MDEKEKIEEILSGYKILKSKLQNKAIKQGNIRFPFTGIDYSQPSGGETHKISKVIENYIADLDEVESEINDIHEIIMIIESSLQCLSQREYRIIIGKYFEDKPHSYIAAEEDVSKKTVKNYKNRALDKLKKTDLPEIYPKFTRFLPT